jgi:coenzyme PQQ precursor peptide PqqA
MADLISWRTVMTWNKPIVTEVCIGLEINDYFPAEI